MKHKPIITFLSDFGTQDGYVGAVKGVLKSYNDAIDVVDITHDIESFNIKQAAFAILHYYDQYPEGTVHLAVVDPGVGSQRNVIIVQTDKYSLVGPDNGIFQYVIQNEKSNVFKVNADLIYKNEQGATFHARDIFAPIAARLALGEQIEKIGKRIDHLEYTKRAKMIVTKDVLQIEVDVIIYDKFGNIIFDYSKFDIKSVNKYQIKTIRFKNFESNHIYDYYSQVTKGSPLFLWNSLGFMELAICEGDAKKYFHCNFTDKAIINFK